jgi:hypothetical protein
VAVAGGRAYAATDVDIFVKGAGGWSRAPIPSAPVSAIMGAGSRLYVAQPSAIYVTEDGENWSLFPGSNTLPPDITFLAVDGAILYASTNGGSIFATSLFPLRQRTVRH